jgi:hypothetical protein
MDLPGRFGMRASEGRELLALCKLIGVSPESVVLYLQGAAPAVTVHKIQAARASSPAIDRNWILNCGDPNARIP